MHNSSAADLPQIHTSEWQIDQLREVSNARNTFRFLCAKNSYGPGLTRLQNNLRKRLGPVVCARLCMPTAQQLGCSSEIALSRCHADYQVVGVIIRGVKINSIHSKKDHHSKPANALVPVDETVVSNQGLKKCRGFLIQSRIDLSPIEGSCRPVCCRIEQTEVANWADP